jgi:N-acetyl-alpha-D-glucosaminyl L-malate synthase BshA
MERTRVLHIIKSLGRGGAEMLLPETLSKHDHEKYEFHYIYFLPWKTQMVNAIEKNGGTVLCMAAKNNLGIFRKVPSIKKYIQDQHIDIVHCHLPWAGIAGRIAAKWAGVPVIYTEHNNFSKYHIATRLMSRLTLPLSDVIIPVSADADSALKRFTPADKIRLVLNGVDTDSFDRNKIQSALREQLNIGVNDKVIVAAAVFRKQKRLDLWLQVAHKLIQQHKNFKFILIGDGPEKETLTTLASTLNIADKIHFTGLQENVRPYFSLADIYLMTSDFEGLPIALLEAMSMSCAPVATAVGGIPEVIINDESGILCEAGDVDGITNAVASLLNDEQKLSRLKRGARKRIEENFSMKNMVKELENIYTEVLCR